SDPRSFLSVALHPEKTEQTFLTRFEYYIINRNMTERRLCAGVFEKRSGGIMVVQTMNGQGRVMV
ncbi:hypothetical protein M3558_25250, partial [Brevibacillus invocatus]|uniref:hypothetical protein n=1 Tax=Brevibacillus invocatus TaxID=173959 RepID=UPI0020410EEA